MWDFHYVPDCQREYQINFCAEKAASQSQLRQVPKTATSSKKFLPSSSSCSLLSYKLLILKKDLNGRP